MMSDIDAIYNATGAKHNRSPHSSANLAPRPKRAADATSARRRAVGLGRGVWR